MVFLTVKLQLIVIIKPLATSKIQDASSTNKTGFTVYIKLSGNASIDKFFDNETFESVKSWLENDHFHFVEKKLIQRGITLVVLSFERTQ